MVYLNAGDTYSGTPWFYIYRDNITAEFMNALHPDAIVSIFYFYLSTVLDNSDRQHVLTSFFTCTCLYILMNLILNLL